tara:strand:+ start:503 stop:1108 length:606 start_codon:yes stop_codon:yes gene_type:complete
MILAYYDGFLTHLFSLWIFIIFMVGTPGPANLLIMTIGSKYGMGTAMRFNVGLVSGKIFLNMAMAIGVGVFLTNQPVLLDVLKYFSGAIMIYLSLYTLRGQASGSEEYRNISWRMGLIVHPLNPKAWVMVILAWTEFGPNLGSLSHQILIICLSFATAQLILHSVWALAGVLLSKALGKNVWLNRILVLLNCAVVMWTVLL